MSRCRLIRGIVVLPLSAALAACGVDPVCNYETRVSADGEVRVALLIDALPNSAQSKELERVTTALPALGFGADNTCVVRGESATSENVRLALGEFTEASTQNAHRFLYIAAEGSLVLDDNTDEPDKFDETIIFRDSDGQGRGEIRDDELDEWLASAQVRSQGSLTVLNIGVHSPSTGATGGPRTQHQFPRSRSLGDTPRKGGDEARWMHGRNAENHIVVAAAPGDAGGRFSDVVEKAISALGVHTPTYVQLSRRLSLTMQIRGLNPDVGGNGDKRVFELHYKQLMPLGLDDVSLTLTIRPEESFGGLALNDREAVENLVASMSGINLATDQSLGEFEIGRNDANEYVLRGPAGRARNRFADLDELGGILDAHRRLRQIASLNGNDPDRLPDYRTLEVRLRPFRQQVPCADGIWDPAPKGEVQDIPLCHAWYVEVENLNSSIPLHLAALVLSSDGSSFAIPGSAQAALGVTAFDQDHQVLGAGPPVRVVEQVMAIGSTEPLDLNAILAGSAGAPDGSFWTISTQSYRVVANSSFLARDELSQREYTIKNFDIRPYLPDDDASILSRFLRKADSMARSSALDGYDYKQHGWDKANDQENLAEGIDCSRAIWFAFTRAGLPYNDDDDYLATAEMVSTDSAMKDEFDVCPLNEDHQIGDILVYRSESEGDGHVVAVIDPDERIAWGSHGWDGNVKKKLALEPDTGVEYQKIRIKQDWQRWDRSDMELKQCWRYRRLDQELLDGRGSSGSQALAVTCTESDCEL